MLKELTKIKGKPLSVNVLHKNNEVTVETCSSNSETTSDEEIDKLEKAFGKHTHVIIIYMVGFNIFGSMDQDLMLYSHRSVNSRAQDTNEMLFH